MSIYRLQIPINELDHDTYFFEGSTFPTRRFVQDYIKEMVWGLLESDWDSGEPLDVAGSDRAKKCLDSLNCIYNPVTMQMDPERWPDLSKKYFDTVPVLTGHGDVLIVADVLHPIKAP